MPVAERSASGFSLRRRLMSSCLTSCIVGGIVEMSDKFLRMARLAAMKQVDSHALFHWVMMC